MRPGLVESDTRNPETETGVRVRGTPSPPARRSFLPSLSWVTESLPSIPRGTSLTSTPLPAVVGSDGTGRHAHFPDVPSCGGRTGRHGTTHPLPQWTGPGAGHRYVPYHTYSVRDDRMLQSAHCPGPEVTATVAREPLVGTYRPLHPSRGVSPHLLSLCRCVGGRGRRPLCSVPELRMLERTSPLKRSP